MGGLYWRDGSDDGNGDGIDNNDKILPTIWMMIFLPFQWPRNINTRDGDRIACEKVKKKKTFQSSRTETQHMAVEPFDHEKG